MIKIVINTRHGGFGLSDAALEFIAQRRNITPETLRAKSRRSEWSRDDPDLVAAVETLRERASNTFSALRVVEIPDGVRWHIADYDGLEHIAEDHRTWD